MRKFVVPGVVVGIVLFGLACAPPSPTPVVVPNPTPLGAAVPAGSPRPPGANPAVQVTVVTNKPGPPPGALAPVSSPTVQALATLAATMTIKTDPWPTPARP